MPKIDKKFLKDCIDNHPEVKAHSELFGLSTRDLYKVLKDDYEYVPADPTPIVTVETDAFVEFELTQNSGFKTIDDAFNNVKHQIKNKVNREYNITNLDDISDVKLITSGSCIKCYFSHSRTETKSEVAVRMVQDAEDKSLFCISHLIIAAQNKRIKAEDAIKNAEENRRIQKEIDDLEMKKDELIKQLK